MYRLTFARALLFLLSLSLPLHFVFFGTPAQAQPGQVVDVRIAGDTTHNGWTAEIDIQGLGAGGEYELGMGEDNDPSNAKIVFTFISPGFDAEGNAVSVERTVFGTHPVRKPYPDEAQNDEGSVGAVLTVKVALSDFVYQRDSLIKVDIAPGFYVTDAGISLPVQNLDVENYSTLQYPKVVGRWAWPGYERVTGDFVVEAVCFHRFARGAKPVACVRFDAIDSHNHSASRVSSSITLSVRGGDANPVYVYGAVIPVNSFNQGDVVTVNFRAYPWIGDEASILDSSIGYDGVEQPDERIGPLHQLIDMDGTYGVGYAVVDALNGIESNEPKWVYPSQGAVEAAYAINKSCSYSSVGRAAAAVKSYHNALPSTLCRRNSAEGGVILMSAGNHTWPGYIPNFDLGAMNTWLIVTKLSSLSREDVIFNKGTNESFAARKLKFYEVTHSNGTNGAIRGRSATDVLWIDRCLINLSAAAGVYQWQQTYLTRSSLHFLGGIGKTPLIRGNSGLTGCNVRQFAWCMLGNHNINGQFQEAGGARQSSDNGIVAYNSAFGLASQSFGGVPYAQSTPVHHGLAVVQNVIERINVGGPQSFGLACDSTTSSPVNNILIWMNTFVGAKVNLAYNETGTEPLYRQNWSVRGNIFEQYNIKTDTYGTMKSGSRTGNWPVLYGVGHQGNIIAYSSFDGEFDGPLCKANYRPSFRRDNSAMGDGAGGGDYHWTGGAPPGLIAAGQAPLPRDLDGNPRRNDGTGSAGAYEFIVDTDNDLMPDEWEKLYFQNISQSPDYDFDEDGITNLREYLNGTDPTVKDMVPGFLTVHICPQKIIAKGAKWRLDNKPTWYESGGTVSGIAEGVHRIEFSGISGWETPASQLVYVSGTSVAQIFAKYSKSANPGGSMTAIELLLMDR